MEINKDDIINVSIDDERYKKHKKAYQYALDMTIKEIKQACEGMFHNLNTLQSRSGNQLPFSSINYGTCTMPEGRMLTKALLESSIDGLGSGGRTSIFPCCIFQYKKDINDRPGTPNYDLFQLALKSTSQRLYPNYCNCDWSVQKDWVKSDRKIKKDIINELSESDYERLRERLVNNPDIARKLCLQVKKDKIKVDEEEKPYEIASTMGCRTVNGMDINFEEVYRSNIREFIDNGNMKYDDIFSAAQKDGRGNIAPVTIILPTIAMRVKNQGGDIDEFIRVVSRKIGEAKNMLLERFNHISSQPASSAKFMWENGTMCGYRKDEGPISALKHGTIVIGQLGLAEALRIMLGYDQTDERGMVVAQRIEKLFNDKCSKFKKDLGLNFGVYYTPAESLCYTAMKKFRDEFGVIPGISDKEYFTNSMHVPVWCEMDPFKKIDIESHLTGYSNAGCITYIELPSTTRHNIEALETIVRYAMDKDVPYFAINIPNDHCERCGYTDEFNDVCPKCGSKDITQLRRVTGYLSIDYRQFNKGKQNEVKDRVKHIKN